MARYLAEVVVRNIRCVFRCETSNEAVVLIKTQQAHSVEKCPKKCHCEVFSKLSEAFQGLLCCAIGQNSYRFGRKVCCCRVAVLLYIRQLHWTD
ncbi:uncharacterized protein LOC126559961 [Anopheles maculipalpis]|uniref:uncharacterized protein LOC126559961 n=1 Tax=Anopheles maculipalpis TaxID=1496333 RepID=UPI0021590904|nr:uncharacterized protein LOC126559961 [Anopheles maculipalpis]